LPGHGARTRVAVIGCGAVARLYYLPALRELESAGLLEVVALVDPVAAHMARLREAFPEARSYPQIPGSPADSIDLAIVASPHSLHAVQSIQLLQSGLAVLCEKPMATTSADARAMERAAAARPGQLAVALVRRFFPAARSIRDMLALRTLGDIRSFEFSEGSESFAWPAASSRYFDRRESQGGVLMDIGAHALDLLQWWLGKCTIVGYADDAMGGIEANCLVRCRLESGATGQVRLSRDCSLANRYTVRGTLGWISWRTEAVDQFEFGLAGSPGATLVRHPGQAETSFEQAFLAQLRNVVAALQGTDQLFVPAAEGIAGTELIEECYRQRSLMPQPWLDDREIARARELNGGDNAGVVAK
jgi:predicted dehydrogenase